MPEGHTIHRLARYHGRKVAGRRVSVSSPQGRFADGATLVDGRTLKAVEPLGKHLFYRFDNDLSVHVHLGMRGLFRLEDWPEDSDAPPEPRGQVRMRLDWPRKVLDLTGPIICETLDESGVAKVKARLGPDVLDPRADAEAVWRRISRSKAPVGVLLMDQSVVSGIGNAYRAEVLYRQGIDPRRPGKSLSRDEFDRLWRDSVHLLKLGVEHGHIVTVDPADVGGKGLGEVGADERFYVYKRETCRRCGGPVERFEMNGRGVYVCPREQGSAAV